MTSLFEQHHNSSLNRPALSSGREFYDDGYTEEERNAPDLPTSLAASSSRLAGPIATCYENPHGTDDDDDDEVVDLCCGADDADGYGSSPTTTSLEFFGRSEELGQLQAIRDRIMAQQPSSSRKKRKQQPPSASHDAKTSTEPRKGILRNARNRTSSQTSNGNTHASANININLNTNAAITTPRTTVSISDSVDRRHDNADMYARECAQSQSYPAALIWGISGTGKSRLVEQFLESCCTCGNTRRNNRAARSSIDQRASHCSCCYVLHGKCDEYTGTSDPFSAIVQALNDFSTQLRNGPKAELERIRCSIREAFVSSIVDDEDGTTGSSLDASNKADDDDESASVLSALIAVVPSLSILLPGSESSVRTGPSYSTNSRQGSSQAAAAMSQSERATTKLTENSWNKLRYIFIQFTKAISTPEKPVYMFLDDLQWSSAVGLELLASLVGDPQLHSFLLLGSIRQETNPHNNEVMELNPDAPLRVSFLDRLEGSSMQQQAMQDDRNSYGTTMTSGLEASATSSDGPTCNSPAPCKKLEQLSLCNLSLHDTTCWLSTLLDRSKEDIKPLATKIYAKTHGNTYFTIHALEELERKNILVYSRISFQWEWNIDHTHELPISDNIVSAIEAKLHDLPRDLQHVMCLAAYIRSNFDLNTLHSVVENELSNVSGVFAMDDDATRAKSGFKNNRPRNKNYLSRLLEKAVLEQLVFNPIGDNTYRFAHDRIQQAAHGTIPYGELRDKLRLRVGHCLLDTYRRSVASNRTSSMQMECTKSHEFVITAIETEEDDSLLFVAADHLNSVPSKNHMFIASLNLEVGERALKIAALGSAAGYLQKAANALKRVREPWKTHYEVCLRLYRSRSDTELSLGHFDAGYGLGQEVINHAKTLDEKLPTYLSMVRALGRQDKHVEALSMSVHVSRQLGEFPKRYYIGHVMKDMRFIKSFLKQNTNDQIVNLPIKTEYRKIVAMRFLNEVGIRAFMTQSILKWVVHICKLIRLAIEHGLCEDSAMAFASLGIFFSANNDQDQAVRCADIAHRILERTNGKTRAGWVYLITSNYIYPFSKPMTDTIHQSRKGYTIAMEAGEFEIGFLSWQSCNLQAYFAGFELEPLVKVTELISQNYKMYRVTSQTGMTSEFYRLLLHLTGRLPLDWSKMKEKADEDMSVRKPDPSKTYDRSIRYMGFTYLATIFHKYELAEQFAKLLFKYSAHDQNFGAATDRAFSMGIIAAGRFRETGQRKYIKILRKHLTDLKTMIRVKGPNATPYALVLEAEEVGIRKAAKMRRHSRADKNGVIHPSAKNAYDVAIMMASRSGQIHDAAVACELAGEYYVTHGPCDKKQAGDYLIQARDFYKEWGCVIKVKDIEERRAEYLAEGAESHARRTKLRSRHRPMSTPEGGTPGSNPAAPCGSIVSGDTSSLTRNKKLEVLSTYTPTRLRMGSMSIGAESSVSQTVSMADGIDEENPAGGSHNSQTQEAAEEEDNVSVLTDAS